MNGWINFSILWMLTGSPVAAALILLAAYAIADWYTFGFLRGVAQAVAAFQRGRKLRLVLLHNPHDRKARADLGEILVSQRRYARAIEVVKAAIAYKAAYAPVAGTIIEVDTPGLTAVNPERFAYRHIRRPMFPLDP